ncbi:MAG TPA: hypothetical protein VN706_04970 [Gemmatimonadaceae bacterium]|nr:hypothetical protein [Gemmatimonadaceae bacterium]
MRLRRTHSFQYVIDSGVHEHVALTAHLSRADRWRVAREEPGILSWFNNDVPPFDGPITTYVAGTDAFWFGALGQPVEPAAILRFDRTTHTVSAIATAPMAQTAAIGLALTRRALFFIGDRRLEWLAPTGIGLSRYDLHTHTWRRFTSRNSPIPDDDATAIASSGDTVFVATHDGIAVYDDARDTWTVRFFTARATIAARMEVIPGSGSTDEHGRRQYESSLLDEILPRWTLRPHRATDTLRELAIVAAAAELSPTDSTSPFAGEGIRVAPITFIAAMRSVPVAHYDSAYATRGFDIERVLADSGIVRFAAATIRVDSERVDVNQDVIGAVGRTRARQYLTTLQAAVRADSSLWSPNVSYALAALGDSAGFEHLRAYAATPLDDNQANMLSQGWRVRSIEAAERLVMLRDTSVVGILSRQAYRQPNATLYELLHEAAPPAVWRATLADAIPDPRGVSEALRMLDALPPEQLAPDSATRRVVTRLARRAYELPPNFDSSVTYQSGLSPARATDIMLALGDGSSIPTLISALAEERWYLDATVTLIELTGIDSLPVPPKTNAAQRTRAQRFWREWWRDNEPHFRPVDRDAGVEALRRYRDRWIGRAE